jgi:hypothetical protein
METPKSEGYLSTIRQQMETLSWLNGLLNADALIAQRTSRADERERACGGRVGATVWKCKKRA